MFPNDDSEPIILLNLSELADLQAIIFLIWYLCWNHNKILASIQTKIEIEET